MSFQLFAFVFTRQYTNCESALKLFTSYDWVLATISAFELIEPTRSYTCKTTVDPAPKYKCSALGKRDDTSFAKSRQLTKGLTENNMQIMHLGMNRGGVRSLLLLPFLKYTQILI